MKIGIIGSGNVGKALAGASVKAGHSVTIASRDAEHARAAAEATGATPAVSTKEAVKGADIVILAIPATAVDDVVAGLGNVLDGLAVVDVTNRVNPQNPAAVLDGSSMSEYIQTLVPYAHAIKAFNTVLAARQANPVVDGIALDGFVAGDDESAKKKVLELVGSMGLRPIDAGPLVMARALEAMALLNIMLQIKNSWPWQSGWKLVGAPAG